VVVAVGDVHVARPVNRHPVWTEELGRSTGTVSNPTRAVTGERGHDTRRVNLADPIVVAANPESQSLSYELDSEGFKLVADRLVLEAGIHPMLHRQVVAPAMEGDRIIGVITESKAGLRLPSDVMDRIRYTVAQNCPASAIFSATC
jgi:hypothetical protein